MASRGDQGAAGVALGDGAEPGGFDISGFIHPRGDALAQQMEQGFVFSGRGLQQFGEPLRLLSRQGQGRNTLGFPFGGQLAVSAQHGIEVQGFTPFFRTVSVAHEQGA